MTASEPPATAPASHDPWFRRRPALAIAVAAVLYGAVLVLRLTTGGPADAHTMLFALPVALLAGAFGLRAGLAAGIVAVALIEVWVAVSDITISATGWVSRAVPLLLLGGLVGQASDQSRRAEAERLELEAERRDLEAAALLHREAIEINDSLIQGMVAAKWSLESGQVEAGQRILEGTITQAQEMVSRLIRRAEMGGRTEPVER